MSDAATPDEALIARYAAGDADAFEALYARHERRLWRYVLRQCVSRATAEELMQEVWFAVAREAPRFRRDGRFVPWLYAIARHRLIDQLRGLRHHASFDDGEGDGVPLAERLADERSPQPADDAERGEQRDAILSALNQLPALQREAFVLQADCGLGLEEIATITGTSFETTKSRLRYAREKLKVLLRDYA
jgi:RNA polymerase sigma factor (sigma-70 family)